MATLYWKGVIDDNFHTLGNWFTNEACTVSSASLPLTTDDVVMFGNGLYYCYAVNENITVRTLTINDGMDFVVALPRPGGNNAGNYSPDEYYASLTATVSIDCNGYLYGRYNLSYTGGNITSPVLYLYDGTTIYGAFNGDVIVAPNTFSMTLAAEVYGDFTVSGASDVTIGAYFINGHVTVSNTSILRGSTGNCTMLFENDSEFAGNATAISMTFNNTSKYTGPGSFSYSTFYNATFNHQSRIEYNPDPAKADNMSFGPLVFNDDSYVDSRLFGDSPFASDNAATFNDNAVSIFSSFESQSFELSAALSQLELGYSAYISSSDPSQTEIRYEKGLNGTSILGIV